MPRGQSQNTSSILFGPRGEKNNEPVERAPATIVSFQKDKSLLSVVQGVIAKGLRGGLRASYVAKQAGLGENEATRYLDSLVNQGYLRKSFDLTDPIDGRTVLSYEREEDIPYGRNFAEVLIENGKQGDIEEESHLYDIDRSFLWITYRATDKSDSLLNI